MDVLTKHRTISDALSTELADGLLFHSQGVGFTRIEIYSVTIAKEDVME